MNSTTLSNGSILRALGLALQRDEIAATPAVANSSPVLFRVCGWCKVGIGTAPALPPNLPGDVTHSVCPSCKAAFIDRCEEYHATRKAA